MTCVIAFEFRLIHGTCVGVVLPELEEFSTDSFSGELHPLESELARPMKPPRQRTFVGGRVARRRALDDRSLFETSILMNARGAPEMPVGWRGSICHKQKIAVALASQETNEYLGVDVQSTGRPKHLGETMALDDKLHETIMAPYCRAGEEAGYWGRPYLQKVKRKRGTGDCQRTCYDPEQKGWRAGFDMLLEARRPELTLEGLVPQPRYQRLFTEDKISVAKERLSQFEDLLRGYARERLYPNEPWPGRNYPEGSRKQVRVNVYAHNARARAACLSHHGSTCTVCELSLSDRYGELGNGFIHVH